MADLITFSANIVMFGPDAMMRAIFRFLAQHASDNEDLMLTIAREDEFDAQGGWFFDHLSPSALARLQQEMHALTHDLPRPIEHWNEGTHPVFCKYFNEFKEKLAQRIDMEPKTSGQPESAG